MAEPDLNLLIALDALLASASVAGAARRLGLSASAMSRTLSRLRAVTGDPLLVRAGRNMVLTPYAEAIRERTQNAVFAARSLLRPPSSELNLSTLERAFTLRANEGFVVAFGPSLIAAAAKVAPLARLCFVPKPEKTSGALREGQADLEIGVPGNMGPEIRLQALFRDRFVGVVRKGHPLEQASEITPELYAAYGHVVASRRANKTGSVDEALEGLGMKRNIAARVPSFPAALAVVQVSDLVAHLPESFLINQPMGDKTGCPATLWSFELPVKTEAITVSQMWHPRLEADPAHRWLRQLVLQVCREKTQAAHAGKGQ